MEPAQKSPLRYILEFVLSLGWGVVIAIYRAWTLTVLWSWFIMGFAGLPALPMATALGVTILMNLLTADTASIYTIYLAEDKVPSEMRWLVKWAASPAITTLALASGYLWVLLCGFFGI